MSKIFSIKNEEGEGYLLLNEDGSIVTQLDHDDYGIVWPLYSDLCAGYEHYQGIILSLNDIKRLNIEIED